MRHAVLQAWGNPPVETTRFNVTLANGMKVRPFRVLKNWLLKIIGYQFSVNFIVMKGVDYDILLGRPWMRNARVIEDCGNNLIFLGNRTEAVKVEMDI